MLARLQSHKQYAQGHLCMTCQEILTSILWGWVHCLSSDYIKGIDVRKLVSSHRDDSLKNICKITLLKPCEGDFKGASSRLCHRFPEKPKPEVERWSRDTQSAASPWAIYTPLTETGVNPMTWAGLEYTGNSLRNVVITAGLESSQPVEQLPTPRELVGGHAEGKEGTSK